MSVVAFTLFDDKQVIPMGVCCSCEETVWSEWLEKLLDRVIVVLHVPENASMDIGLRAFCSRVSSDCDRRDKLHIAVNVYAKGFIKIELHLQINLSQKIILGTFFTFANQCPVSMLACPGTALHIDQDTTALHIDEDTTALHIDQDTTACLLYTSPSPRD